MSSSFEPIKECERPSLKAKGVTKLDKNLISDKFNRQVQSLPNTL